MKVVLDTNCLVQIIVGTGYRASVWSSFLRGEYTLCYTTEILLEYEEVLKRLFDDEKLVESVLNILITSETIEAVNPSYRYRLITEDPDDNKFVDCAITCGATYIVSDDKHYNILKDIPFPHANVKKLKEFADILKARNKKTSK